MSRKLTMGKIIAGVSVIVLLAACAKKMEAPPVMMTEAAAPVAPMQQPMMAAPRPMVQPPQMVQQGPLPGSVADFQTNVGDKVFFAYDKSDIDDRARATLQKQAAWLQRWPTVVLIIEGHADERGTREYNLALGARRAQAAKDYLASLGVSGARLETISYGKERPVCVQSDEACWAQNRRGVSTIKSGAVS